MNVLTVCKFGLTRSVTTEFFLKRYAKKYNLKIDVKAAGLLSPKIKKNYLENIVYYTNKSLFFIKNKELNQELITWANLILPTSKDIEQKIKENYLPYIKNKKMVGLDIHWKFLIPYTSKLMNELDNKFRELNLYQFFQEQHDAFA